MVSNYRSIEEVITAAKNRTKKGILPPDIYIKTDDFQNALPIALEILLEKGIFMTFGSPEETKYAINSGMNMVFFGRAIKEILKANPHPDLEMGPKAIEFYNGELLPEFYISQLNAPEEQQFDYSYVGCFLEPVDQYEMLRKALAKQIETGIQSNRHQITTWNKETDMFAGSPPCLQIISLQYIEQLNGVILTDVFRSRDGPDASTQNQFAIANAMNECVIKPNDCEIIEYRDFSFSWHAYTHSLQWVLDLKRIQRSPQERYHYEVYP